MADADEVGTLPQLGSHAIPAGSQDCHPALPLKASTHLFLGHFTKATYMLIPGRIRCHSASHSETTVTQASWPPCPHPGLDQQKPRLLGVELDKEVAQLKQLLQDTFGPRRLRTQAGILRGHTPTRSWLTAQPRWRIIQRQHHQYPAGKPEDAHFQAINNKNKLTSTMHTGKTELSFYSLYRK